MTRSRKMPSIANTMFDAGQRLSNGGHRVTQSRQRILATLLAADSAMTPDDICEAAKKSGHNLDRVTAYRVLDWLVEQRLAHRIASDSRAWQFNASKLAEHEHVHFACQDCDRIYCLDDADAVTTPQVPAGFKVSESELLLRGHCPNCSK
ncbi:MAG: Fur family transcriptional regulator [Burkholderiaceae bacterium]